MKTTSLLLLCTTLLAALSSCRQGDENPAAGSPGEIVPEVAVLTVHGTQVPVTANLPGRMEAYLQAEVRARVTGIIQERCYQEGQTGRPGDLLFKIEPAPLQAVLDECKATVARAKAVLADAEDKAARYSSLVAKGAVSVREHKQAMAEEDRARAEYAAAAASLEQARLNLEYTRVEAPISGRVRRALVTEGAFANQNEFTHLTTIEQIDPIYVRFCQPASQYSSLRRAVVSGLWKGVPLGEIKVRLLLSNGEEYPHSGKIIFSDMAVDPNTDTIEMRAQFPNPDYELLPGAYVRVVFEKAVRDNVFAIPRDAVIRTAQGASVFVVGPEGVLEMRPVKADTLNGREWLVSEGLKDGDKVAVSHIMSLRPGMKVRSAAPQPQSNAQQ